MRHKKPASGYRQPVARAVSAATSFGLVGVLAAGCLGGGNDAATDPNKNADAKEYTLTITSNAIADGKNAIGAKWIEEWVIPQFEKAQKKKGITAKVKFEPQGVDDAKYKSKIGLDLDSGKGADVIDIDGIWVGEFAESEYILPLEKVVGADSMEKWDGWKQIPDNVEANGTYKGDKYGVPKGTDGRVVFYNKNVFKKAGLPGDWQPKSWADIIDAAEKIKKKAKGVTPLQINAGTAMGESTTMEAFLPLLAGTGNEIFQDGKWQGDTDAIRDVLGVYEDTYQGGLGDATLQKEAQGRQKAQERFSKDKVGIMMEGDYFWRDVVSPGSSVAPMKNRDSDVGFAKIPSMKPGSGVDGQDFVSMSGGGTQVINPNTKYPQQAWELMQFMGSAKAVKEEVGDTPRITQREDVNSDILADDPLLSFIAEDVVPVTRFRPSDGKYVKVSEALQKATYAVVEGKSAAEAAKEYQKALEDIVGADKVSGS
ncbi:extracellular solute-binding protein [Stackebrandtia nassauensis]|uniref:Extracellular solute-binding protein family 1 n=1 Tax=Stackebrandtia nassauensis (strain DSM 44728 / CIP 108903 / NRRL B-16338 / NBRC 102104 / LLR-40K-21) TaxID=446470 RepID=D3PV64_STANL|nr:extracellular solute-binding protein [Stackebrandtia nassauensis]ADD41117.1 extracellular solute-binding protein family 1 [Stackebrandtia nassauensis DSM 44728]